MAKRKYVKKSDYWGKFDKTNESPQQPINKDYEPELVGDPFYVSSASYNSTSSASYTRGSTPTTPKRANRSAF